MSLLRIIDEFLWLVVVLGVSSGSDSADTLASWFCEYKIVLENKHRRSKSKASTGPPIKYSLYIKKDLVSPSSMVLGLRNVKVKVGVLRPVQQPGSYWDRSSELPLVGLEPTEVTAYD